MKEHKIHLRVRSKTLCGLESNSATISLKFAKTYKEANCKRCIKSWNSMYMKKP